MPQKRGRVVDQKRRAANDLGRDRILLSSHTCEGELPRERRLVRQRQRDEGIAHGQLLDDVLRLNHQPHESNSLRPLCKVLQPAELLFGGVPLRAEELLVERGGRRVREALHHGHRVHDAVEHRLRELHDELVAAPQRHRHSSRQIGHPMDEIEGDVRSVYAVLLDLLSKSRKEHTRWRLRLHEPAVVEAELELREPDGRLQLGGQRVEARQRLAVVLKHVAERHVVVTYRLALGVPEVRRVLRLHLWPERLDLHDVVDRGERQHRRRPLDLDLDAAVGLALEQAGVLDQLMQLHPVDRVHESEPLLALCQFLGGRSGAEGRAALAQERARVGEQRLWHERRTQRPRRRRRLKERREAGRQLRSLFHAEAEAALPVQLLGSLHLGQREPHQPVDGEERAPRAVVLVLGRKARRRPVLVAGRQVQLQLWEELVAVGAELVERVTWCSQAARDEQ
mmetsp:Transcript_25091/g.54805  ORF Transcript_25091/g.54805 Transcript_25091/m.54805 type:complete len:453 (-) Transcript_25091:1155-2513(-)